MMGAGYTNTFPRDRQSFSVSYLSPPPPTPPPPANHPAAHRQTLTEFYCKACLESISDASFEAVPHPAQNIDPAAQFIREIQAAVAKYNNADQRNPPLTLRHFQSGVSNVVEEVRIVRDHVNHEAQPSQSSCDPSPAARRTRKPPRFSAESVAQSTMSGRAEYAPSTRARRDSNARSTTLVPSRQGSMNSSLNGPALDQSASPTTALALLAEASASRQYMLPSPITVSSQSNTSNSRSRRSMAPSVTMSTPDSVRGRFTPRGTSSGSPPARGHSMTLSAPSQLDARFATPTLRQPTSTATPIQPASDAGRLGGGHLSSDMCFSRPDFDRSPRARTQSSYVSPSVAPRMASLCRSNAPAPSDRHATPEKEQEPTVIDLTSILSSPLSELSSLDDDISEPGEIGVSVGDSGNVGADLDTGMTADGEDQNTVFEDGDGQNAEYEDDEGHDANSEEADDDSDSAYSLWSPSRGKGSSPQKSTSRSPTPEPEIREEAAHCPSTPPPRQRPSRTQNNPTAPQTPRRIQRPRFRSTRWTPVEPWSPQRKAEFRAMLIAQMALITKDPNVPNGLRDVPESDYDY
ncbi:hypothetical protein CSOJ01_08152 [Colletotrichum sojae]|uniref:Uncharacterized protein n=1 Tax=Colletotrichum sojae TaxID=2175907 RepID=A0A8H6MSK8_9PEZI|nr:hypothetical protein CSOJ01_08152 [Colletotrichum sojae]